MGNRLHPYYHCHWPVVDQQAAPKQTSRLLYGGDITLTARTIPRANPRMGEVVVMVWEFWKIARQGLFTKKPSYVRGKVGQAGSETCCHCTTLHHFTSNIPFSCIITPFRASTISLRLRFICSSPKYSYENRKGWEWIIWKRFWRYR